MTALEIIELAALFVLGGFLLFRYRRRILGQIGPDYWKSWRGSTAFDATELNKAMRQVRSDYVAAKPKPKSLGFQRTLLAFARRAVVRLPYFHDREQAHEHRTQRESEEGRC